MELDLIKEQEKINIINKRR